MRAPPWLIALLLVPLGCAEDPEENDDAGGDPHVTLRGIVDLTLTCASASSTEVRIEATLTGCLDSSLPCPIPTNPFFVTRSDATTCPADGDETIELRIDHPGRYIVERRVLKDDGSVDATCWALAPGQKNIAIEQTDLDDERVLSIDEVSNAPCDL